MNEEITLSESNLEKVVRGFLLTVSCWGRMQIQPQRKKEGKKKKRFESKTRLRERLVFCLKEIRINIIPTIHSVSNEDSACNSGTSGRSTFEKASGFFLHWPTYQNWEACSPPGYKLSRSSDRISFRNILYVTFSRRRSLDHIKAVIRKET